MALALALAACVGCLNAAQMSEISRLLFVNQLIDFAKWRQDRLDIKTAMEDDYRVYGVKSKLIVLNRPDGGNLRSLAYYPAARGVFPIVLFSHGYTASAESQLYLFRALARRGYIVIACDHDDAVNFDRIGIIDGRIISGDGDRSHFYLAAANVALSLLEAQNGRTLDILAPIDGLDDGQLSAMAESGELLQLFCQRCRYRLADMQLILESIGSINQTDPDLKGLIDEKSIILAGHSLGGATALAIAGTQDPRFKGIICLSPYALPFNHGYLSSISLPILYMSGDLDGFHDEVKRAYCDSNEPKLFVEMKASGHMIFTDFPFLYGLGAPLLSGGRYGIFGLPEQPENRENGYVIQLDGYQAKAAAIARIACAFAGGQCLGRGRELDVISDAVISPLVQEHLP